MFFRKWREKRRAKIVRQWMLEAMSIPPVESAVMGNVDEAEVERWWREQTALSPAPEPTVVLDCGGYDIEQKVQALLDWQAQTAPWLKTILESHRDTVHFLEGQRIRAVQHLSVMSSMLDSLVMTHVRPDVLQRKWSHEVPELIDHISDKVPDDLDERFKEDSLAWKELVKHYTELIARTAARYEKFRKQDDD